MTWKKRYKMRGKELRKRKRDLRRKQSGKVQKKKIFKPMKTNIYNG